MFPKLICGVSRRHAGAKRNLAAILGVLCRCYPESRGVDSPIAPPIIVVIMAIHAAPTPGLVVLMREEGGMDEVQFAALLDRARGGDSAAVAGLLGAFEADVRLMVRARLPRAMRSQFDSLDFVQAVWQSVFARGHRLAEFANPGHFRGYLAGVARNKVFAEYRRGTTRKFDLGREEPLYFRKGGHDTPRDLPGADPSPSQVAQADECLVRLLDAPSAEEAEMVRLRSEGRTIDEIAESVGRSERSVRRAIQAARGRVPG